VRTDPEERADQILQELGVSAPPVAVEGIAKAHGIPVVYEPFSDHQDDVSGMLLREVDTVVIGINSRHSHTRQRFTLAHELGHYYLHKGNFHLDRAVQVKFRDATSSMAVDRDEIQANAFAAALLMPKHMFTADILARVARLSSSEEEFVSRLAEVFDVSHQAMQYRLVNLGVTSGMD
jgi:Zn-dependent peptidase ImmA (M78 family)